jgi:hypothetical protein
MKKRLILTLAIVAGLMIAPLPAQAAPVGATLTYGRIDINVCVQGCDLTTIAMVGTYVVSGKVYVGQILGVAQTTYSEDHAVRFVAPFTLTGVSQLNVIRLSCDGLVLPPETGFRIACAGQITGVGGGGFGYRTVVVKGTATDVNLGGTTKRRIQGNYRGVA